MPVRAWSRFRIVGPLSPYSGRCRGCWCHWSSAARGWPSAAPGSRPAEFDHRALPPANGRSIGESERGPALQGMPWTAGRHEIWGIFKCHEWGDLLRHSHQDAGHRLLSGALAGDRTPTWRRASVYADPLPGSLACFEDDFEACIAHLRVPVTHRASFGRRTSSNGCSSKNGEAENPALHGVRAAPDRRRQKRRPRALTSSPHRYLRCTSGTHSGIRLGFAIDFKCCYAARAAKEAYYCSLPQASSVIDQEIKHLNIENVQPRRRA